MNLLASIRKETLEDIRHLLKNRSQTYFNNTLPYCRCIKYLEKDGSIMCYQGHGSDLLDPCNIDDLPVEALTELREKLRLDVNC